MALKENWLGILGLNPTECMGIDFSGVELPRMLCRPWADPSTPSHSYPRPLSRLSYAILDCKTESLKIVKSPDSRVGYIGGTMYDIVCVPFLAIFNINTVCGQHILQ